MKPIHRPGLAAFTATLAIIVPAGLYSLHAGPKEVAQLVRPDSSSFQVDGATVAISAAEAIIEPGSVVHLTLVATANTAKPVKVTLLTEENLGRREERVSPPPETVSNDEITLQAAPGGGPPKQIVIKIPSHRNSDDVFQSYTILALAPPVARKLEHLHNSAGDSMSDQGGFWTMYWQLGQADDGTPDGEKTGDNGQAARLEVRTRMASKSVRLILPDVVRVGEEVVVGVEYTNQTQHVIDDPYIALSSAEIGGDYLGIDGEKIEISDKGYATVTARLKPGEKVRYDFKVKVTVPGLLGLETYVSHSDDGHLGHAIDAIQVQDKDAPVAQAAASAPAKQ